MGAQRPPLLHRLGDAASELGRQPPKRLLTRILVQGGLSALVLGFLVYTVADQWHQLSEEDVELTAGWLAPALAAMLLFQAATGLAWWLELRALAQDPSPVGTQLAWVKSLLARYVPGGILFIVTRVILTEREGVPRRVTLTAIAYETGLAFVAGGILASWFLFDHAGRVGAWSGWVALAVVAFALVCMQPDVFARVVNRLLRAFGRDEVPALISPRRLVALAALYLVAFAVSGLGMWCVARAIYPATGMDLADMVGAQSLAFCAAVVMLVFPGGLGVRDGVFAWAITPIVPGESFALAAAIALAGRLVWTASELLYFVAVSAAARRSPGRAAASSR